MNNAWIPEIRDPNTSKYMALVASIEQAIANGVLRPGDKLPSNREISEQFGVTVATVSRAMGEAVRRGLVEGRVGSGTFVCDTKAAAPRSDIADLSLNTLPTAVVGELLSKAMAKLPADAMQEGLFSYHSYIPSPAHRQLAAEWINTSGEHPDLSQLLCTTGVHQGLLAAFRSLLRPGDRAICEGLTYTGIRRIAEYANVELVGAQCDDGGVIPESVEEMLARSSARVVVLTPTMHNPTTATLSLERRQSLASLLRKYDAILVEDGVNVPLANDGLPTLAALAPDRVLYLTGFSKCVASGFRLGYAAVPDRLLGQFHEALVSTQWIGPGVYTTLAHTILADGIVARCIDRHRTEARERMNLARSMLAGMSEPQSAGYHAWVPVASAGHVDDLCARALQAGVRISPGSHFAVAGTPAKAGYRVSLGTIASQEELARALALLARVSDVPSAAFATLI